MPRRRKDRSHWIDLLQTTAPPPSPAETERKTIAALEAELAEARRVNQALQAVADAAYAVARWFPFPMGWPAAGGFVEAMQTLDTAVDALLAEG